MTDQQLHDLNTLAAPAAIQCEQATGVPAEPTVAQWITESDWGAASPENNCFGIKEYAGGFGRQMLPTGEWLTDAQLTAFLASGDGRTATPVEGVPPRNGARKYRVRDWFATFPTLADCLQRHAHLLTIGIYQPAWSQYQQDRNLDAWIRGFAAHYATDPDYAQTILTLAHGPHVTAAIAAARQA